MEGKSADDDPRSGAADDEAGSSSDEILMSTLAHLEDLLMDTVTFGDEDEDEEWNASNSKQGESLREELREFEERAAEAFQAMLRPAVASTSSEGKSSDGGGGGGRGRRGEFSLEHTELHRQFSGIVEGHVEAFLSRQGSSSRALVDAIRRVEERSGSASASGGSGGAWALDASREIIDLLKEVDDFELWANNMLQKAENQRAAAMSSSSLLRK
jgi:hypothetical protein